AIAFWTAGPGVSIVVRRDGQRVESVEVGNAAIGESAQGGIQVADRAAQADVRGAVVRNGGQIYGAAERECPVRDAKRDRLHAAARIGVGNADRVAVAGAEDKIRVLIDALRAGHGVNRSNVDTGDRHGKRLPGERPVGGGRLDL